MFIMSLKQRRDFSSRWLLPAKATLDNYALALKGGDLMRSVTNTAIIVLISTVMIIVIGSMAAYPLARFTTKFSKGLSLTILGVMMVPPLSVLVPLYREMVLMKGVNTFWGIIVLSITYGLPTSVFMYTNFIHTIPVALDEAALLDALGSTIRHIAQIILVVLRNKCGLHPGTLSRHQLLRKSSDGLHISL